MKLSKPPKIHKVKGTILKTKGLDSALVSFGEYLLSSYRNKEMVRKQVKDQVHHSDLFNWKENMKA